MDRGSGQVLCVHQAMAAVSDEKEEMDKPRNQIHLWYKPTTSYHY
jgi:hypothetical protein